MPIDLLQCARVNQPDELNDIGYAEEVHSTYVMDGENAQFTLNLTISGNLIVVAVVVTPDSPVELGMWVNGKTVLNKPLFSPSMLRQGKVSIPPDHRRPMITKQLALHECQSRVHVLVDKYLNDIFVPVSVQAHPLNGVTMDNVTWESCRPTHYRIDRTPNRSSYCSH
jgi:hypothetical protein